MSCLNLLKLLKVLKLSSFIIVTITCLLELKVKEIVFIKAKFELFI
jgi:hypothetical protein